MPSPKIDLEHSVPRLMIRNILCSCTQDLNEFTHGKQDSVSKSEFQHVLSDILLGMAAGLKRDPIVILRINGEDLNEFVDSPRYEPEASAIFSQVNSGDNTSLRQCLLAALRQLTVDHGMPPASDFWVTNMWFPLRNIALSCAFDILVTSFYSRS